MEKIWLSPPHMNGHELPLVIEAFQTNWIAPVGPHITAFEQELTRYTSVPHTAVLGSGTAAIHLALILLGVSKGDEVICSSFTFAGSCNPVIYQGAIPVFVDSEESSWNMDPSLLEEAINERRTITGRLPKAIILVHLYGMPAKVDSIFEVARRYEIPVIEDAAEALGSSWNGDKLGSFGDLSVLSFNGNKIITTSGGGALLSHRPDFIERAKFLATQAREPAPHYEHKEIGYNYRLSNVCAAIGLGQMKFIDDFVDKRRKIFESYFLALSRLKKGFRFQEEWAGARSNRWLTTLVFESSDGPKLAERLRVSLANENIESRPLWKPMHLQPAYATAPNYVNGVSQRYFERGICLPSGTGMTRQSQERVIEVCSKVLGY